MHRADVKETTEKNSAQPLVAQRAAEASLPLLAVLVVCSPGSQEKRGFSLLLVWESSTPYWWARIFRYSFRVLPQG